MRQGCSEFGPFASARAGRGRAEPAVGCRACRLTGATGNGRSLQYWSGLTMRPAGTAVAPHIPAGTAASQCRVHRDRLGSLPMLSAANPSLAAGCGRQQTACMHGRGMWPEARGAAHPGTATAGVAIGSSAQTGSQSACLVKHCIVPAARTLDAHPSGLMPHPGGRLVLRHCRWPPATPLPTLTHRRCRRQHSVPATEWPAGCAAGQHQRQPWRLNY